MITQKGTKTLYTERLILRKFTVDDADDMFNNWANDERVTRFLSWKPHKSVEETRELLKGWCTAYENDNTYNWAIVYEGKTIGSLSVVTINEKREFADLGYCMGYDYWNKGIMTEAVKAVIDYLFSEIGINRIGISHAVKNFGSGKVAQKCGLTYEGTKREFFKDSKGEFHDMSFLGILRKDWENKICCVEEK